MAVARNMTAPTTWLSRRSVPSDERRSTFAIRMLILFLVLEYVGPPLLAGLQLQFVIILVTLALWCAARNRPWSRILTAQVLFLAACVQAIPFASNNYSAYFTSRTMLGHVVIALGLSWLLATRSTFRKVT